MKKRHKAEEIIRVLRDIESSPKVQDAIRRHNISDATYYNWKKKYGGMSVEEGKRLRALEDENRRLKRIVGEQSLVIGTVNLSKIMASKSLYKLGGLEALPSKGLLLQTIVSAEFPQQCRLSGLMG